MARGCKKGQVNSGMFKPGNQMAKRKYVDQERLNLQGDIKNEILLIVQKRFTEPISSLENLDKNTMSGLDYAFCKALKNNDAKTLNMFLTHAIGKPKESIDINADLTGRIKHITIPEDLKDHFKDKV